MATSARGRLALLSRACSPLVVPARSLSVGFYRQARLPELSLASVDEASSGGSERLNDVRAATRSLLAPHPMGLRRDEYLEAMNKLKRSNSETRWDLGYPTFTEQLISFLVSHK